MKVHFDLNNQTCYFELNGNAYTLQTRTGTPGAYWQYVFAKNVTIDTKIYSISWKVWMGLEQFVEIETFSGDEKSGWKTISKWSYIDKPQGGTCQTRKIKHSGHAGADVSVSGSPFGDWSTLEAP